MEWLFQANWLVKSIVAMVWITPAWLLIGFASKHFGMKPEITFIWYVLGMLVGSPFLLPYLNISFGELKPTIAAIIVVIFGIVIGALTNMLVFGAVNAAPNPGLPVAIVNASSILVFVFSALLAILLPKYFNLVRFDVYHLVGILLTMIGIGIIALHK